MFHLINTDSLELPQRVNTSAAYTQTRCTLANSHWASWDTSILHTRPFQLIPFIPLSVFQHAHRIIAILLSHLFFLSPTFCHLLPLSLTLSLFNVHVCVSACLINWAIYIKEVPWPSPQLILGAKHAGSPVAARAALEQAVICSLSIVCLPVFVLSLCWCALWCF